MTDKTIIGQTISRLRREKGLTQAELADRLCVSHQAVSQWERAETLPDILTLPALAEALSTNLEELLGVTETAVVPVNPSLPPVPTETDELTEPKQEEPQPDDGGSLFHLFDKTGEYEIVVLRNGEPLYDIPAELDSAVKITLENPGGDVRSALSLTVNGSVTGDANAGASLWIGGDVGGDASSGTDMTCGLVQGDVSAGMTLNCADIAGDASAGMNIHADNIGGDASAGMTVSSNSRGKSDSANCTANCRVDGMNVIIEGNYDGNLSAAASVTVNGNVNGDADAKGNLSIAGDVNGDASAGGNLSIAGDVEGDADAKGSIQIEGDLDGDAECGGALTVEGDINGDVKVKGNVQVDGDVNGDIRANEVHVDGDYNES